MTESPCGRAVKKTDPAIGYWAKELAPIETVMDFERKLAEPTDDEMLALQSALENAGAVFISDNGRGIGVRLKFTKSEAKRIAIPENEGGIVAPDRVP
ncbi:hypothetical protein BCL32_2742 [Rhizobium mongolense USDA 1844]|uniref:Uncharacterized protein n=1 Tax=Rhizobium mongolense USDA 1844 TaxID=1079460 RepID=A0A559TID8_9HYPH|nr:hypothetical protein BCL32_2742 [Rhizobium mongolense USDA 1844]